MSASHFVETYTVNDVSGRDYSPLDHLASHAQEALAREDTGPQPASDAQTTFESLVKPSESTAPDEPGLF